MTLSELPLLTLVLCGPIADASMYNDYNAVDNITLPAYDVVGKPCIYLTQSKPFTLVGASLPIVMGNGTDIVTGLDTYQASGPAVFIAKGDMSARRRDDTHYTEYYHW